MGLDINPIGKVDTGTVQINATTSYLWMAEILMATEKVNNVTCLICYVNGAWDTTAQTSG